MVRPTVYIVAAALFLQLASGRHSNERGSQGVGAAKTSKGETRQLP